MKIFILFAILFVNALATPHWLREEEFFNDDSLTRQDVNYRLDDTVIPTAYLIEIVPYFATEGLIEQFSFSGTVEITLQATVQNNNKIVLHQNKLLISSIFLFGVNANSTLNLTPTYDNVTHKLTIDTGFQMTPLSPYKLTIKYTGVMDNDMNGFYRSSYIEDGVTKWMGTTQFQATSARRAFPCFDEPKFKATFTLKISRPNHYNKSHSNTMITSSDPDSVLPNRVIDTFEVTPVMSTYLLAFIVSQFVETENVTASFSVLTRRDAVAQAQFALKFGPEQLDKLNTYIDYPFNTMTNMKKMRMAALPDFSAGAMENWGLLTYRETAMLYDENVSTYIAQQRVAAVITHEQAHMWFGDLVTCEWWSYTWLNEGFARFFQYFGTHMVYPEWNLDYQFIVEQLQSVFIMDSLESSHPMTHEVNTPSEASNAFDSISYNKAASIIRMFEHAMGSDKFQLALREYIKLHEYTTSTPEKLFTALQRQAEFDLVRYMTPWTTQSGYPVINVVVDKTTNMANVKQHRFLLKEGSNTNDTTLWDIPLTFATKEADFVNTKPSLYYSRLNTAGVNINLTNATRSWTIFNIQQTGYYRVNYDSATWNDISVGLRKTNFDGIHVLNRAQIVDDLMNFARADMADYHEAFSIIEFLENEKHYIPWLSFFNGMNFLTRRFTASDLQAFSPYIRNMLANVYNYLGFEPRGNDTRLDVYNRVNVLQWACKFDHQECIQKSNIKFNEFRDSETTVDVNLRPVVYCSAIRQGTEVSYTFLWNKFLIENVAAEQVLILSSLGCVKNEDLVKDLLTKILSDKVRLQDKSAALTGSYSSNEENVQVVLDYVITNSANVTQAFGSLSDVASILNGLAARFTTVAQVDKVKKFMTDNPTLPEATKVSMNKALADAEYNMIWATKNVPKIVGFYKSRTGAATTISVSLILLSFAIFITTFFH